MSLINCPPANVSVKVTPSGTGPAGTICASGDFVDVEKRVPGLVVRVKTFAGNVLTDPATPQGDFVTPSGQNWFKTGLAVDTSSATSPGATLTIAAWVVDGTTVVQHQQQTFFGLVGGGRDCCAVPIPIPTPTPEAAYAAES